MPANNTLPEPLTPRERDVLQGMVEGLTNAEIAERLVLSAGTVKWYVKQLYGKLNAHTRDEAVARALSLGLVATNDQTSNEAQVVCPLINPLPQDVSGRYVGNADKLARLASLLHQRARLVCIYGRAGSGKTALACQALAELRQTGSNAIRPDGIVCLSAISTGITLDRLLVDLARLLPERAQVEINALARNNELAALQKIGGVLEKIADRHIVVLLDNLETVQNADTGELLDSGLQQFVEISVAQSRALTWLITSQVPPVLPRALKTWEQPLTLDGLEPKDGVALLRKFDPSGVAGLRDAPEKELVQIAERLGGFPRALESVAGMLLEDPLLRLAQVKENVDLLEGEISVAVVQQALAHLNGEAMRVLNALAIFGQPVNYDALSFLLTPFLADSNLRAILGRLIRSGFVKVNGTPPQFALHPIDQSYCYHQIPIGNSDEETVDPSSFTRIVLHRRAAQYYREHRLPKSDWRQLSDLQPSLNEIKHWIQAQNGDEGARVLLEIDRDYVWEWGYRDLLGQLYSSLAGSMRDPHLKFAVARRQAWLKFFSPTEDAEKEFTRLLDEARRLGFVQEEADALDDLAQIYRRGNRELLKGIEYHRQALMLYRQIGDRRGEADALGGLGAIYTQIDQEEAIDYLLAAATIQRELGNRNSTSFLLSMLGEAHYRLGAMEQARTALEEAKQIAQASRSPEALNRALGGLAQLYVRMGDIERGRTCIEEAFAITHELTGVPFSTNLVFYIYQTAVYMALTKHARDGIDLMERVLEDVVTHPQWLGFVKSVFSFVLMLSGDCQRAFNVLPEKPEILLKPSGSTFWFGVLLIKTGQPEQAVGFFRRTVDMFAPESSALSASGQLQPGTQPVLALALAGLALIRQDTELAAQAVEVTRQSLRIRNLTMDVYPALIDLLIEEPGGDILAPIREILDSRSRTLL